jgi:integrase
MARDWCWTEKRRGAIVIRYNDPILKKPNGDPKVGIDYPKDERGEPIRSKAQAAAALAAFKLRNIGPTKRATGSVASPPRFTIQQLALKWLAAHPKNKRGRKYLSVVQKLVDSDHLNVTYPHELTARLVKDYKQDRGFIGVHKDCAYLRSILNWAQNEEDLVDPFCQRLMKALAQPQSKRSRYPLMSPEQYEATMAEAKRWGDHAYALAFCLSTYGWRASTGCQVCVGDVDLDRMEIHLKHVKDVSQDKDHEPVIHPLHPATADLLRPLMEGRATDEILFLHGGKPWTMANGGAAQFTDWYRRTIKPLAPEAGNANAWKRYAVHCMTHGLGIWPDKMDDEEIRTFTGHEDVQVVSRYRKTNPERLRHLVRASGDEPIVVEDAQIGWCGGGVDFGQGLTNPDERVSFGT